MIAYGYAIIQEAFSTIKIKEDMSHLHENLVYDYQKMNKITKASVYTIQECAAEGRSICIFFYYS